MPGVDSEREALRYGLRSKKLFDDLRSLLMTDPKEKRRLERYDLEVPAEIEVIGAGLKEGVKNLLTMNICSGGAFFHTTQPLAVGTKIRISLVLPLDRLKEAIRGHQEVCVRVTGRVLRSESDGMAVSFNQDYRFGQ